jgi:zinc transport system ATP-binding protein
MICVFEDVSYKIGKRRILDHISLTVPNAGMTTVIGPNGAGKSTLLKLMAGILKPTSGHIRRKPHLRIGYVPQKFHVNETLPLTVADFLHLGKAGGREVQAALKRVQATHLETYSFHTISEGEKQRVLLAHALLSNPQLLLLDEPTQGLDIGYEGFFYDLLRDLSTTSQMAIVMASHDLHMVFKESQKIICLNQQMCCTGGPKSIQGETLYQAFAKKMRHVGLAPYLHHHIHHKS